jgi:hypothetical protein
MRRLRILLSLVLLLAGNAQAQFHHVYTPPPSGGSYTGPLDAVGVSAVECFSFVRGCSASYATGGNAAETITRTSDSHFCNLNVATGGGLSNTTGCGSSGDNGQTLASFLSGTTGTITSVVDQTGNGNTATGSIGLQLSCNGSLVCGTFNGTSQALNNPSFSSTAAQPYTMAFVFYMPSTISSQGAGLATYPVSIGTQNASACTPNTSPCATAYAGFAQQSIAVSSNAWHSLIVVFNGASSTYSIDGASPTTVGASLGTDALTTDFWIGAFHYAQYFTGNIEEGMIFASALTNTEQTNLCHNFRIAFTTGGTC